MTYRDKVEILGKYYAQNFCIVLVWGILVTFITDWTKKQFDFNIWDTHQNGDTYLRKNGVLLGFWLMVIKMPFIEEMAFRLFLNLKWQNIAISVFFILFLNLGLFLSNVDIFFRFIISFVVFVLSFYSLYKNRNHFNLKISEKQQHSIQILSILIFGLYHITNFIPINVDFFLIYPIYTIPQIILGYYLTKVRMEFGILWSIGYHMFNNLIPFCFQLIFSL